MRTSRSNKKLTLYIACGAALVCVIAFAAVFIFKKDAGDAVARGVEAQTPTPPANAATPYLENTATPNITVSPELTPSIAPEMPDELDAPPPVLTHKPVNAPDIRYDVALTLYDDMRRLHGVMRVYYTNTAPTAMSELVFKLHPNAFMKPESAGSQAEIRSYPSMTFTKGETIIASVSLNGTLVYHGLSEDSLLLRVPFDVELLPKESVEALIEFAVDVPVINARFGYTQFGYQLGNFLPVLSVYQDGEWVEDGYYDKGDSFYSEVADYAVALKYPEKYTLAGTGKIISEQKSDGMVTSVMAASNARDFSLMLMQGVRKAEETYKHVTISSYALSEASAKNGAAHAKHALELFSELIGEYPYDTLCVAQAELYMASGMEYTSFMMIDRQLYLSGKETELKMTIYHETAHQYFYSLVGSDQINSPWIDEGLASYFGVLPFERQDERLYTNLKKSLFTDRAQDGANMDGALNDFESQTGYANSVYWRGGAMYDALRELLGDEIFFGAVRNYVNAHANRIAVKADLVSAFEKESGLDLESFFYEWLE